MQTCGPASRRISGIFASTTIPLPGRWYLCDRYQQEQSLIACTNAYCKGTFQDSLRGRFDKGDKVISSRNEMVDYFLEFSIAINRPRLERPLQRRESDFMFGVG